MTPSPGSLRVAHVQPMSMDFFGHPDEDIGRAVTYSVTNLAAAQARLGHRPAVHLLSSSAPCSRRRVRELEADGVDYRFHRRLDPPLVGDRHRFGRQLSVGMLAALRPGSADLVHYHGIRQMHFMYAAVAWRAARLGIPMVAQDRGFREVRRPERAAQRWALRRTAAVCGASQEAQETLSALGVPAARLHLIPNGFDPERFRPDPERTGPHDPLRVMFVSRLVAMKDPLTMARALVELQARGRRVHATLLGPGDMREEVARVLDAGGVEAELIRHLPQAFLAKRLREADVLVQTSRFGEGWTQSVLEAMACGLPVIATDVSGVRDVLGGAGVTVPVGDAGAMAAACELLADEPARWREHRRLGLERARSYSWDAVAAHVDGIYRAALEAAPVARAQGLPQLLAGGVR